jgi:predicted CDP-diglyceride synthetase/phosphatidate cytidylyltransferase
VICQWNSSRLVHILLLVCVLGHWIVLALGMRALILAFRSIVTVHECHQRQLYPLSFILVRIDITSASVRCNYYV